MAIRFERKTVLAKIETTYGVDPTPTGAANAVLLKGVDINPLQGERVPRELLRTGYGHLAGYLVGRHVIMTCRVDLAGSGAAGTAPAYGPLLRACGVAETITAATKVDYTPVNSGFESLGIYFNIEGTRTIMKGVRGNAKLRFRRNALPEIEFAFIGLWVSDTSVALPALTTTAWKDPIPSTKANTPTFTIDGQVVVASGFELDFGMDCARLERINREEVVVRDRRAAMTASIEELALATKNFFAMVGNTPVALAYTHGTVAGSIVDIAIPAMQLQDAPRSEEEKDTMLAIAANIMAGSPDFTLSIK